MRVLHGTSIRETPPDEAEQILSGRRIVMDVGTGDGRWPYEMARRDESRLYVGLDPDASAMAEYAYRASRKPARGGVENVLHVVASVEQLPAELAGVAERVVVNYPWGSLLRGLLAPERAFVAALASLGLPGASIEIVLTYDPAHDHGATPDGTKLMAPSEQWIAEGMAPRFEETGVRLEEWRLVSRDEALAVPSTWGRRLLHGREREVYLIRARKAL